MVKGSIISCYHLVNFWHYLGHRFILPSPASCKVKLTVIYISKYATRLKKELINYP